jgi:hypothetical protein
LLLLDTFRDRKLGKSFVNVLITIVAGLWFGLLVTFGWQLVRAPLIYLVISIFVATVAALSYRAHTLRNQSKLRSSPG